MNLSKAHVYLLFDIYFINMNLGRVSILINKMAEMEKWKEPNSCLKEAIDYFKSQHPEHKYKQLTAYYWGDEIPKL